MIRTELDTILENHGHWLREDIDGWDTMRANLTGAILSNAILRGADLTGADLTGAILRGTDLTEADLSNAILRGADLRGADLRGADLRGADLRGADLRGVTPSYVIPLVCPSDGAFIAWKKAGIIDARGFLLRNKVIVKLLVPANALRSSATSRKCRCSKAMCLAAYIIASDGTKQELPIGAKIVSCHDYKFSYSVREWIEPDSFDPDRWNECSNGIHFFITEEEAIEY